MNIWIISPLFAIITVFVVCSLIEIIRYLIIDQLIIGKIKKLDGFFNKIDKGYTF